MIPGQKIVDRIIRVGIGGGVLLGATLVALYYSQNKLIYHPEIPDLSRCSKDNPKKYRNPNEWQNERYYPRNIEFENIQIESLDKIILKGWILKQSQSKSCATIIFYHENSGSFFKYLNRSRIKTLLFKSLFQYMQSKYYHSCIQVIIKINNIKLIYIIEVLMNLMEYQIKKGQKKMLLLFQIMPFSDKILIQIEFLPMEGLKYSKQLLNQILCRSLGGATSTHAVCNSNYKVQGMILENTFTSMNDMVKQIMPVFYQFSQIILNNPWNTIEIIQNIKCPILFIKSLQDEIVPSFHMDELQKKCYQNQNIIEYIIEDGDHNSNWTLNIQGYFEQINQFIDKSQKSKEPNL